MGRAAGLASRDFYFLVSQVSQCHKTGFLLWRLHIFGVTPCHFYGVTRCHRGPLLLVFGLALVAR